MKRISWKQYKEEINSYGEKNFMKKNILSVLVFMSLICLYGIINKLDVFLIVFTEIFYLICVPLIIKSKYKYRHEKQKFADLDLYMEQMCASFNKKAKIISALKDSKKVVTGKLKEKISKAIEHIETGISSRKYNIFQEAFMIIEDGYECKRLEELHRFLIRVENNGGEYKLSLNGLLKDILSWIDRTYLFWQEKVYIKIYFGIGVFLSMIVSCISLLLFEYIDVTVFYLYKIMAAIFLCVCIFSYALFCRIIMGSWIVDKRNEQLILSDYKVSSTSSVQKIRKKLYIVYLAIIILSIVFFVLKFYLFLITCILMFIAFLAYPYLKFDGARKRTISELKYSFSEWIRSLCLRLSTQTLQISLQESYKDAPIVLKEPLKNMLYDLEVYPSDATPYSRFLKKYNIHEIDSSVKMLYSLSELGDEEMYYTLDSLLNRNFLLIKKSEEEIQKNKIMFLKQIVSIPLVFAALKIMIDMLLFIKVFLSGMIDINNFI